LLKTEIEDIIADYYYFGLSKKYIMKILKQIIKDMEKSGE